MDAAGTGAGAPGIATPLSLFLGNNPGMRVTSSPRIFRIPVKKNHNIHISTDKKQTLEIHYVLR
jgi:hypothetical protein